MVIKHGCSAAQRCSQTPTDPDAPQLAAALTTPHSPLPSLELKSSPGPYCMDSWLPIENMEGMLRMTVRSW